MIFRFVLHAPAEIPQMTSSFFSVTLVKKWKNKCTRNEIVLFVVTGSAQTNSLCVGETGYCRNIKGAARLPTASKTMLHEFREPIEILSSLYTA